MSLGMREIRIDKAELFLVASVASGEKKCTFSSSRYLWLKSLTGVGGPFGAVLGQRAGSRGF